MIGAIKELSHDIVIIEDCVTEEQNKQILSFMEEKRGSFHEIKSVTPQIEAYYSKISDRPMGLFVHKELDKEIDSVCFNIFGQIVKSFIQYQFDTYFAVAAITGDTGYRLSIYDKDNNSYKFHTDAGHTNKYRMVSAIIGLNSDYEGGELHFPKFKTKVKLQKGQCVLFPSGYTHPHEVLPVTKGERKTLMTWFI